MSKPIITLSLDEIAHAVDLARRRNDASHGRTPMHAARKAADALALNIDGALGEVAAACYHRLLMPDSVDTFHSEPDLPPDWDIKWVRGASWGPILWPRDPEWRYCLVTGHPPTYTLHGWIWRHEVRQEWWRNLGHGFCWVVPQKALHPMPGPQWWSELAHA